MSNRPIGRVSRPLSGSADIVAASALAVVVLVVTVGTAVGSVSAAPTDSTTLKFDVVGTPGGALHLSVGPDGGVPAGLPNAEVTLPRAVVHDDRGGGARTWSATVATSEFAASTAVSYRVDSLQIPDTGSVLNRMPAWTTVRAAQEAVVASGISRPSVMSAWEPRLRVGSASNGTGSSILGSGSLGSSNLGSSNSSGSGSSHTPSPRGALIVSVM